MRFSLEIPFSFLFILYTKSGPPSDEILSVYGVEMISLLNTMFYALVSNLRFARI